MIISRVNRCSKKVDGDGHSESVGEPLLMFYFVIDAAGTKETGNTEQAYKSRLFVHVLALIGCCHSDTGSCSLGSHQVLVGTGQELLHVRR